MCYDRKVEIRWLPVAVPYCTPGLVRSCNKSWKVSVERFSDIFRFFFNYVYLNNVSCLQGNPVAITSHLLPVAHNLVDPHRSCNLDKTRFGTPFCCLLFVLGSRSGWARQHSASSSLSQCCSRWLGKTQSRSSASLSEGKCYNVQSSNCFLTTSHLGILYSKHFLAWPCSHLRTGTMYSSGLYSIWNR